MTELAHIGNARAEVGAMAAAPRVASLPWYDLSEVRWATDAFWSGLARHLRGLGLDGVPDALCADERYEHAWRHPSLLLSQCCGLDAVAGYRDVVRVVATPRYRAPGCTGASYSSLVFVPEGSRARALEDLRGGRCAINSATSHSGANGLRELILPLAREGRFFSEVRATGSHAKSLELLQRGTADIAAIDCVVVELLRRHRPALLEGVRPIAQTAPAPAPPFVTRTSMTRREVAVLQGALNEVFADRSLREVREVLLLDGVECLGLEAYEPMAATQQRSARSGYRELDV